MAKSKWLVDGNSGLYFPIPATTVLHMTPGPGIYKIAQGSDPMDRRLGLLRLFDTDKFEFPDKKIYSLGTDDFVEKVEKCWNSELFTKQGRNLAIALTGVKGSGKTYLAKLIANKMDMPTLILDNDFDGLVVDFITSLEFECTIIIDEAEKIFNSRNENSQILLRILDGLNNSARKLYIMTTNEMSIDDNLLGRPGRVRYIKNFSSLAAETVKEIIDNELVDKSKTEYVKEMVDMLTISTIDVVRNLIEEVNIFGEVDRNSLSLPLADYTYDIWSFSDVSLETATKIDEVLKKLGAIGKDLLVWGKEDSLVNDSNKEDCSDNVDVFIEELNKIPELVNEEYIGPFKMTSTSKYLLAGDKTSWGTVVESVNKHGWLLIQRADNSMCLIKILKTRRNPSL